MNKILTLLIISIALIGIGAASASSDVDKISGDRYIIGGDFLDGPSSFPIASVNIPLAGPFNLPFGDDIIGGNLGFPFVAAVDPSLNEYNCNNNALKGSFDFPISDVPVPLNGPLSLPIVGVDVEGSIGMPIIEYDIPF